MMRLDAVARPGMLADMKHASNSPSRRRPTSEIAAAEPIRLTPHALAFEGHAVARDEGGFVHFVDGALPGETVMASVLQRKPRHAFAVTTSVLTPSPDRRAPPCPAFGRCGGCHFLHCSYAAQVRAKRGFVLDALRFLPDAEARVEPMVAAPAEFAYRNKVALSIDRYGHVGFHEHRSPDRIAPLPDCCLVPAWMNACAHRLSAALSSMGRTRADPHRLVLREGARTGERMIWLQVHTRWPDTAGLMAWARESNATLIVSSETPPRFQVLEGRGRIAEQLCGFTYEIAPRSFFQVNTAQAERLFERTLAEAANLAPRRVADLYAGAGALTALLAREGAEVIGVESSADAVEDARATFVRNQVESARMICSDVGGFDTAEAGGALDLIVVDPPRTGMERTALDAVVRAGAPHLFYISCHPATLARDLKRLMEAGYALERAVPFDLFPQSFHVETLAILKRATRATSP